MVFIAIVVVYLLAAVLSVPTAFFLMLFLGNLGVHLGFWACLPGALVLATPLSNLAAAAKKTE